MEGLNFPSLFELVLLGMSDDLQSHRGKVNQLHKALLSSQSNIKAAQGYLLNFKTRLKDDDFKIFSNYLKSFSTSKAPEIPNIGHLAIATPSACRASKLFYALNILQIKKNSNIYSGFLNIKRYSTTGIFDVRNNMLELEEKRVQCTKLVANLKYALGINLQKTMTIWNERQNIQTKPKPISRSSKRKHTLNVYERKEKVLNSVKAILNVTPIIEQTAF